MTGPLLKLITTDDTVSSYELRRRHHNTEFVLVDKTYRIVKSNFIVRILYKDIRLTSTANTTIFHTLLTLFSYQYSLSMYFHTLLALRFAKVLLKLH